MRPIKVYWIHRGKMHYRYIIKKHIYIHKKQTLKREATHYDSRRNYNQNTKQDYAVVKCAPMMLDKNNTLHKFTSTPDIYFFLIFTVFSRYTYVYVFLILLYFSIKG